MSARLCRRAADQGNAAAQYNLGFLYEHAVRDVNAAVPWYRKAARAGYPDAQGALRRLGRN